MYPFPLYFRMEDLKLREAIKSADKYMTVFDEVQWKVLTQDLCHKIGGIWSSEWVQSWIGLSMAVTDVLITVRRS